MNEIEEERGGGGGGGGGGGENDFISLNRNGSNDNEIVRMFISGEMNENKKRQGDDVSTFEGDGTLSVSSPILYKAINFCDERVMMLSTIILQGLNVLILCVSLKGSFTFENVDTDLVAVIVLCSLIQILQVAFDVLCVWHLLGQLHKIRLHLAWRYYIFMIVSFSGKYLLAYVSQKNAFLKEIGRAHV